MHTAEPVKSITGKGLTTIFGSYSTVELQYCIHRSWSGTTEDYSDSIQPTASHITV